MGLSIAVRRVDDDAFSGFLAVSWSGILLSFQIQCVVRFRETDSSRQGNFCGVIAVKAGDIRVVGIREGFLGLNHFNVVGYSRGEAITRLLQGLSREPDGILCNGHFLCRILQVKESVTNLLVDAGTDVFESLLGFYKEGICDKVISVDPASLENG